MRLYKPSCLPLSKGIRNVNRTFPKKHREPKLKHDMLELQARLSGTRDELQETTLLDGDEKKETLTRFVTRGVVTEEV